MIAKKPQPANAGKNKRNFGKGKNFRGKQKNKINKTKQKNVQAASDPLKIKKIHKPKYSKWGKNTSESKKDFQSPDEKLVLTGEWLKMSRQRLAERHSKTVVMTMPRTLRLDDKDLERLMKDTVSIKLWRDEKGAYVYLEYESPFDAKMKKTHIETLKFSGQAVTAEMSSDTAASTVNPYILWVDYIPAEATFDDVQTAFPTASRIKVKLGYRSGLARKSAIIFYEDKNVAGQVFKNADKMEIKDTKVPVTFIRYTEPNERKKRSLDETTEKEEPKTKKLKVEDKTVKETQEEGEGKSPKGKKKKQKKTGQKKVGNGVKAEEVKEKQQVEVKSPKGKKKKPGQKKDSNGVKAEEVKEKQQVELKSPKEKTKKKKKTGQKKASN